jgi:hypothetical protein
MAWPVGRAESRVFMEAMMNIAKKVNTRNEREEEF